MKIFFRLNKPKSPQDRGFLSGMLFLFFLLALSFFVGLVSFSYTELKFSEKKLNYERSALQQRNQEVLKNVAK